MEFLAVSVALTIVDCDAGSWAITIDLSIRNPYAISLSVKVRTERALQHDRWRRKRRKRWKRRKRPVRSVNLGESSSRSATRDRSRTIVTDQLRSDPAAKAELVRVKAKLITDVH